MFRHVLLAAVLGTAVAPLSAAFAQDSSGPPTIGQRLDRFRKNLFGAEDETTLTAPPPRSGGHQPASAQRGNPAAQQRPGAREPLPERTVTTVAQGGQRQSSRRTYQPGYTPASRDPLPDHQAAGSSAVDDDEPRMPSGHAGPRRAQAPTETVETFEPTLADRSPASDSAPRPPIERMNDISARPIPSSARAIPSRTNDEAGLDSSAPSASGGARPIASNKPAAPQTLEERLAAARSKQTPNGLRPSASAPPKPAAGLKTQQDDSATAGNSATVGGSRPEQLGSDEPIERMAVRPMRKPLPEDRSAAEQASDLTDTAASAPPNANELRGARPVERVARVDKPAPQTPQATADAGAAPRGRSRSAEPNDGVLFRRQSPVLGVETAGPRTIKIGTPAAYNVTMQNTGDVAARDVVVSVKLPEWAEVAATQPAVGTARSVMLDGGSGVQWTIPALEAKSRAELGLSIVPRKSRPFDLSITWTHTPEASQALVEVQEPKLLMNLAGPDEVYFGEREVYKLTLSNPGTGEAENIVVRLLPTSAGDEQAVSHPIGNIAAGESKVVELELTARQANALEIKAEAVGDGDLHAMIDEVIVVRKPELQVAVQGPRLQYAGTPATYRVRVSNPGNATAKNVQVNALLPRGASYLASSEGGSVDPDKRKVTWTIGNLRAGTEATLAFKCQLNAPGANLAQVACHAEGDLRHQGTASTEVEALADLTMKIIDPQGPAPVGQEVVYEVRVKNRGTKGAEDVEIMAFFSPGVEPTAVDNAGRHEIGAGQIVFAPIPVLDAGQEVVYKIRAAADRPGNHVFRAQVTCSALDTKLSADESTRYYVDDGLEPDDAADEDANDYQDDEPYGDDEQLGYEERDDEMASEAADDLGDADYEEDFDDEPQPE